MMAWIQRYRGGDRLLTSQPDFENRIDVLHLKVMKLRLVAVDVCNRKVGIKRGKDEVLIMNGDDNSRIR